MVQVHLQIEKIAAFGSAYMELRTPVGTAEGCDLFWLITINPSQSKPNKRGWRDMPAHWPGSQPWIDCPVSAAWTD
ncbi:hypothetical protein [Pseudomonas sp. A-RE-19]|uniref:hypothetical protein n=1 Tax=Pseudomonas sp. A-RE-19 TaxID=2832401 RepID=UPI001CBDDCCB|nr:hypothetical protein [Pseudomonas sp. A-RE-19]